MEDASPLSCCHLPEGTLLGSYEIKGILGQGGFGISYWAIDRQLGREVVLKEHYPAGLCKRDTDSAEVIPADSSRENDYNRSLNSFCREARIIAALDHPGIVRIHDIFQALGTAYIVMAFVEGCTLGQWLDEHAQDAPQVQKLLLSLLDTLSYLHAQEVFHRDIKPSNIMVKEDASPVLLDFGAALVGLPIETMTVMASPAFSPPEQYSGHGNMGPWSDLFALGRSFISVLGNKLDSYPRPFIESLRKATRLDIEDRFQSAEEWKSHLLSSSGKKSFHWIVRAGLACLTVAVLAGLSLLIENRNAPDEKTPTQPQGSSLEHVSKTPGNKLPDNLPPHSGISPQNPSSYQQGNPYPVPEAPLSLMGTRLTMSSEYPVSTYLSLRAENNYSIGQQLLHYQKLAGWRKGSEGEDFIRGTLKLTTPSAWSAGLGKSGDYAYKKLSKDKGMIILQGYDGPDAPNLHILLHFTTPDSGMAVYTNGEEKLIGNVMFMLETDKPHLRRKELPEVGSLLFPDLEDSSRFSSKPPQSIVGKTLQFNTDHLQYHLTEGKMGLPANEEQLFIEKKLQQSNQLKDWRQGGYLSMKGTVLFVSPYTCEYQKQVGSYIYKIIDNRNAIVEFSDLENKKGESYFLLHFTKPGAGIATQYDGGDKILGNIGFQFLTASETISDKGMMPQTFFEKVMESEE